MKHIILLSGCFAVMSSCAQAGELYRWVDARGKVHYGDMAPPEADQVQVKKFSDTAAPDAGLSYEARRAHQNFPVTLYVAPNCAETCDRARELLKKRGIPFSEKSLKTQGEFDAFKALSGSDGVPTLSVGRNFLKGFQFDQWHNELDIAGYPKIAPYRAPGVLPATVPANAAAQ